MIENEIRTAKKGCSDVAVEVLVWIYRGQHGISSALYDC